MNLTTLKSHLSRLAPLLHTRTPLPVLSCVKLSSDAGFLTIEASNLDQAMKITMPYDGPELACCVGLKRLMGVPGEGEATIVPASGKLSIKGSGFSATLETLPPDEFPATPTLEGKELTLEADFSDALKWVAKAMSTDETRYVMMGVCFNDMGMVASNARSLHIVPLPFDLGGIIIPSECVKVIADLMGAGAMLRWSDRALSVELGDTTFFTKLIEGTFPNAKPVIPTDACDTWEIDATILVKLIASVPPSQSSPGIDVTADGNHLSVKTRDGNNEVEVETPCNASGSFRCDRNMLHDAISGFKGKQKLEVREVEAGKDHVSSVTCIKTPERTMVLMGMNVQK